MRTALEFVEVFFVRRNEVWARVGKSPEVVYLGTDEFSQLEEMARNFCTVNCVASGYEFHGMKVVQVSLPSYMGFGYL